VYGTYSNMSQLQLPIINEADILSDNEMAEMLKSVKGVPERQPKRKRENTEFNGTQTELEAAWISLKGLFSKHPELFNEWTGEFTDKMQKLEKRLQGDFFLKLSPKQKSVIYNSSNQMAAALSESGGDPNGILEKKGKRKSIQTLNEEEYQLAWKSLEHLANPLTSAVEFNYLCNIAHKLREYKNKALLSQMEKDFLKKISVSIPQRKDNKHEVPEESK